MIDDFIQRLADREYISPRLAGQLRDKAAAGDPALTPEAVLKFLVKKQIITADQAEELSLLADEPVLLMPLESRDKPIKRPPAEPPRPFDESELGHTDRDLAAQPIAPVVDPRQTARRRTNEWDSPLLLFGGGGLAVLALVGGLLWFLLFRENADAVLKQANDYFDAGSYTQAEKQYERFVEQFSTHKDYSLAKVRLGLTRIRKAVEGSHDFAAALATAQQVIPEIEDEPAFASGDGPGRGLSEGKRELSSLLTQIAKGLAEQAESSEDDEVVSQRVDQLRTVLGLTANTKYVPESFRLDEQLAPVRATLERVEERRQRDADLAEALAAMDAAVQAGKLSDAYRVRKEIIRQYPLLADDQALAEAVLAASRAEQKLVSYAATPRAAETADEPSSVAAEITLAERRVSAPTGEKSLAAVVVDGAMYALSCDDGAVAWRRFLGSDGGWPVLLGGGDWVVVRGGDELLRVERETGKLLWRLPLGEQATEPVACGDRLLIGGGTGKLFVVDSASGQLVGAVRMTQPIRTPAAVNPQGDRIYVVGEHSNLYTLSADDLSCLGVFYLGHEPGSVRVAPLVVGDVVAVVENIGVETASLRLLALDERGAATREVASERLAGLITTPLVAAGRRVALVTSHGEATVFEFGGADKPLARLGRRESDRRVPMNRYSLLKEGSLWIADDRLSKLELRPTESQLVAGSLRDNFAGDAFDAPLTSAGRLVVSLRRRAGRSGAAVTAVDAATGRPAWETTIAASPAGPPAVDSAGLRLTASSSTGAIYLVDRQAMARRVQDQALRSNDLPPDAPLLDATLDLGGGRLVVAGEGGDLALLVDPDDAASPVRGVPLGGPLACPLTTCGDGFLAATRAGQVFWRSRETGEPLGAPFQPTLVPGRQYAWRRPAALAGRAGRFVVTDGVNKAYLAELAEEPEPHLVQLAESDVGGATIATSLCAVGSRVFAADDQGRLVAFAAEDLKRGEPVDLGGRVAWGPYPVGDGVLWQLEDRRIVRTDAEGAVAWTVPGERGRLVGQPLAEADGAWLACSDGALTRLKLTDGSETGFVDVAQPLLCGPVAFGPRLIVTAADGTLLAVNRP
jgi:outer membrane protein assembly factor BamB